MWGYLRNRLPNHRRLVRVSPPSIMIITLRNERQNRSSKHKMGYPYEFAKVNGGLLVSTITPKGWSYHSQSAAFLRQSCRILNKPRVYNSCYVGILYFSHPATASPQFPFHALEPLALDASSLTRPSSPYSALPWPAPRPTDVHTQETDLDTRFL